MKMWKIVTIIISRKDLSMADRNKLIYLIGFMGCGKSTIGKALAEALNYSFIDMDDYIESKTCTTIKQIFKEQGESGFRSIETNCLKDLTSKSDVVVSCGGGVPLSEINRTLLKESGTIIWLDADGDEIVRRVTQNDNRPLVNDKSPEEIKELKSKRQPIYQSLNGTRIDTSNLSISEIVSIIIDTLNC